MHGAVPPLPHTPSHHHRNKFAFAPTGDFQIQIALHKRSTVLVIKHDAQSQSPYYTYILSALWK
jgi:hypothetical protein